MALHLARREKIGRRFFAVMGLVIATLAGYVVWRGLPAYPNYWGGVVAPWLGVAVGLIISVLCIFFPRMLSRKEPPGPTKPYGAPWEDYKKW